ncbi:MAG TPA: VOC family protein [Polyangia bacterium]|nr:VOC family protein [Polyangia bacterium]
MDMKLEVVTVPVADVDRAKRFYEQLGWRLDAEIFHQTPGTSPAPGLDPERRSYASFATFKDPDDNVWLVQEVRQRLPGR